MRMILHEVNVINIIMRLRGRVVGVGVCVVADVWWCVGVCVWLEGLGMGRGVEGKRGQS